MSFSNLTDEQCLVAWTVAARIGAGGPDGAADRVAVAIVRLVLAARDEWDFPLWICGALGIGGSNADVAPNAVRRVATAIRMAAKGIHEATTYAGLAVRDEREEHPPATGEEEMKRLRKIEGEG